MIKTACSLLLWGFLAVPAFGQQGSEQRKIEYLINAMADLPDATFIRNGTAYNSGQAVAHLRLKLSTAGAAVKTAEAFIVTCATGSSVTGEKYRIKFADGRLVDSAEFLRSKLATYPGPEQHAD